MSLSVLHFAAGACDALRSEVKKLIEDNDHRKQYSMDAKTTLDDLGEDLESLQQKMGALVNTMTTEGSLPDRRTLLLPALGGRDR